MKHTILGNTGPEVTRLSYGCMRIAGSWDPAKVDREGAFAALRAAYDAGYTLFDHADIYARGICESLHGEFLREHPSLRERTVIATKCGIRFADDPVGTVGRYDFSPEWIIRSCEGSLARLGVETIDLYQLHRPDLLMDPELVAEAFTQLKESGKVQAFGVSNFLPSTFDLLQEFLSENLLVNQIEVHLGRLDPFFDGTLDQCLRTGMTPLAWSPLGGGWIGAEIDEAPPERRELLGMLDEVAATHRTGHAPLGRAEIALAWLMKHPSGIVPIVGSRDPGRITMMARADEVELSREEWYALLVAARGERMP